MRLFSLLLAIASTTPGVSYAIKADYATAVEAELSDNSSLAATNPQSDTRLVTSVSARMVEEEGPFTYNADTSFRNVQYTKGTFQDEDYFRLAMSTNWQLWQRRINLSVLDYFNQRSIDALDVDTPTNTQNTNVLRVSPAMTFPLSKRQSLQLIPTWSDFYYQATLNDNQQIRLSVRWTYRMYRSLDISLGISEADIDYERDFISDLKTGAADIRFDLRRKRSSLSLSLGTTSVERAGQADIDGSTINLRWQIKFAGASSVVLSHRKELTDTSSQLLNASTDQDPDNLDDDQLSADVLESTETALRYTRGGSASNFSLWTSIREQDYKITNDDRDQKSFGVTWSYALSALDNIGASWSKADTDVPVISRFDERLRTRIFYSRRHTRQLESRFGIDLNERKSSLGGSAYDETVFVARLKYHTRR